MKKTVRQKRFEWKHLMAGRVFSKPYMLRHNRILTGKRGRRFKMGRLAATVKSIIRYEASSFLSGQCYIMVKGVGISFPAKRVSILTRYN